MSCGTANALARVAGNVTGMASLASVYKVTIGEPTLGPYTLT